MAFFTIAMKLRLVMPKTNKRNKIGDQKDLLANFIFLKVASGCLSFNDTNRHKCHSVFFLGIKWI